MRTRLAAGAVGTAVLLTLFGGSVAAADGTDHITPATGTPAQTHDSTPFLHNSPVRINDRPVGRYDRMGRFRDNPLQATTCALGTVLGRLTGRGNDCVAGRYGLPT
ncbi:hypothetical protein AB0952_00375 [Streptomyces caniferus]|uniref:hypothetical protein n=1 Tax=Streptomyces caniferus TaxID=285557 RepID=UPI003401E3E3